MVEQSVLALLQNHLVTPTSDFEAFHCFETREKNMKFQSQVVWVIRNSDSIIIFLAGLLARAKRAQSGATWVRKFGKLSI